MVMQFGWKRKAEILRMVLLSGGHQLAKELPVGLAKSLNVYQRVARDGAGADESRIAQEIDTIIADHSDVERLLWEPAEIYGWKIEAAFYLQNKRLWWLAHATRANECAPSDKEISFLEKVLEHLGGEPRQDAIIGPRSSPESEPLPFGWWTWLNRSPLFEIQVNKMAKKDRDKVRIVPLGSPQTDGYSTLPSSELDATD